MGFHSPHFGQWHSRTRFFAMTPSMVGIDAVIAVVSHPDHFIGTVDAELPFHGGTFLAAHTVLFLTLGVEVIGQVHDGATPNARSFLHFDLLSKNFLLSLYT
jgi:hypothetical protein